MLCCESGALDKESGVISHFKVMDALQLSPRVIPKPADTGAVVYHELLRFQVVAVWEQTERDPSDTEFEAQVAFTRPEKETEDIVFERTFKFGEKRRHRFIVTSVYGPHPEPKSGIFKTECRVRKVGSKTWHRQTYDFEQTVIQPPPTAGTNGKKPRRRRK
jgi:hypothetical protein